MEILSFPLVLSLMFFIFSIFILQTAFPFLPHPRTINLPPRIITVAPHLRRRITPLIRTVREQTPLDLRHHGPIPHLLQRAIRKVPQLAIEQAGLLHLRRSLLSYSFEDG